MQGAPGLIPEPPSLFMGPPAPQPTTLQERVLLFLFLPTEEEEVPGASAEGT